jgi:deoxyhypusine synthase
LGTAEFHYLVGKYLAVREEEIGHKGQSLLAAGYRFGVPIFTSSPGDSSIGMNLAALELEGSALRLDPLRDVNHSAALVYDAKKHGRSGVFILGGGSPKNFMLQTEPQIQEVLGLPECGHDYFLQITDARPDTGGLSGATPQEAMTWGKVDPAQLPDTVTCYLDSTVALPLVTAYALAKRSPRKPRRLMDRLEAMTAQPVDLRSTGRCWSILVEQAYGGFNIVLCGAKYYALRPNAGAFDLATAQAGKYPELFQGDTLDCVKAKKRVFFRSG